MPDLARDLSQVSDSYQSGNTRRLSESALAILMSEYKRLGGELEIGLSR